jgi:aryl-alcohol dehydrogenase-like predicted oxidoreductase
MLLAVADELGKSPAQVALRWLLQQPGVTAPIIGARTVDQLNENLGAVGWLLDAEYLQRLACASQQRLPYPYGVLRNQRRP